MTKTKNEEKHRVEEAMVSSDIANTFTTKEGGSQEPVSVSLLEILERSIL